MAPSAASILEIESLRVGSYKMFKRLGNWFSIGSVERTKMDSDRRSLLKLSGAFLGGVALTACAEQDKDSRKISGTEENSGPISDRLAIRELIESYNAAVIENDGSTWAANWCRDGVWNLEGQDILGREAILKHWKDAMAVFDFVGMFAQPKYIQVQGDSAKAHWHTNELAQKTDGVMLRIFGSYKDAYRREADGWKIRERRYKILLMEKPVYHASDTKDWR